MRQGGDFEIVKRTQLVLDGGALVNGARLYQLCERGTCGEPIAKAKARPVKRALQQKNHE